MWTTNTESGTLRAMATKTAAPRHTRNSRLHVTPKEPKAPTREAIEFGKNLEAVWKRRGEPKFIRLAALVHDLTGTTISNQAITNYHRGLVDPAAAKIEVCVALARIYGVEPDELHPIIGERAKKVSDLVVHPIRCIDEFPGQDPLPFELEDEAA